MVTGSSDFKVCGQAEHVLCFVLRGCETETIIRKKKKIESGGKKGEIGSLG